MGRGEVALRLRLRLRSGGWLGGAWRAGGKLAENRAAARGGLLPGSRVGTACGKVHSSVLLQRVSGLSSNMTSGENKTKENLKRKKICLCTHLQF